MAFFHPHHSQAASDWAINDDLDREMEALIAKLALDDDLDTETAALITKLALDDLADILSSRKGKGRADSLPLDEEIAYLQRQQFNEWLSIAEDAKLATSIDDALVTNAAYLDALITAEEAAAEDRIAAQLLSRGEALPVPKSCQTRLEHPAFVMNPEPVFITTLEMDVTRSTRLDTSNDGVVKDGLLDDETESTYSEPIEGDSDDLVQNLMLSTAQYKPSNALGKRSVAGPSPDRNRRINCMICDEPYLYFKTPCGHYYCIDCLALLVGAFTRDESQFPLRCCQDPIPVAQLLPALSSKLSALFQQKHAEFSILSKDRLYCSNPNCSTFLGSSADRLPLAWINCPRCHINTCPKCKELAHPGEGCEVKAADEALQALARSKKWQTCPGCHAVVEHNQGCNHMSCRCGTQFCYLCAARWKNCACPSGE